MAQKYKHYSNLYDSVDRREYYQRVIFPERMSIFGDIWKSDKRLIINKASVNFRGLAFGSDPDAVVVILGKPRFVIENYGLSSLIYFYKERVNNHRIVAQVHFWGNEFFYACYTFRDESDAERKIIKGLLFDKYGMTGSGFSEQQGHLEDKDRNCVSIHDSVNFNIMYLWGADKIKDAVSQNSYSLHFGKDRAKKNEQDELRSKL